MVVKGNSLNPHIDNSHDDTRNLYRRLNLLYYMTPNWSLDNGGNFELWDHKLETQKTNVSALNRLVVMEVRSWKWNLSKFATTDSSPIKLS